MANKARLKELSDARSPGLAASAPSPCGTAPRRSSAPSMSRCATHPVCGARTSLAWLLKSRGSGAASSMAGGRGGLSRCHGGAARLLAPHGVAPYEIGNGQAHAVGAVMRAAGLGAIVEHSASPAPFAACRPEGGVSG